MTVAWKAFQDLVARIEKFAATSDAIVRSPDRRRDLVTGKSREIDATIVQRVGSAEVLITVECRKHSEPQDVTWIEQLATKRESVGAALTVAVSSEGFSAEATDLARRKSILTRTLSELSDSEIQTLLTPVVRVMPRMEIVECGIGLADGKWVGQDTLPSGIRERMKSEPCNALIFRYGTRGHRISLNDVFRIATHPTGTAVFDRVPRDGTPVTKRLDIAMEADALVLDAEPATVVSRILMRVKLQVTEQAVGPDVAVRYSSLSDASRVHAEYEIPDVKGAVRLHLQDDGSTPALGLQLRDRNGVLQPARLERIRSVGPDGRALRDGDSGPRGFRFVDPDLAT